MLYAATKGLVLRLFRAPSGPPEAPRGTHASVEVFRASPRFLTYRLLGVAVLAVALGFGVLVLLVVAAVEEPAVAVAALALALAGGALVALTYFLVHLDYDLRYYVVTDRSVRVREGAWTVREQTLTYANVQNLRVTQGPLQRLFGIRDLSIDAAGGGGVQADGKTRGRGHAVVLAGIENAEAVRDAILAHLRRYRSGAGLGDLDDEARSDGREGGGPGWLASPAVLAELRGLSQAARGARLAAEARR